MRRAIILLGLAAASCAGTATASRHTLATARYDAQKRDDLWNRALGEFQSRGVLVAVCDRDGGVLTSQQQPAEVPCGDGSCQAVVAHQLTLTRGGVATLRTNRSVTLRGRPQPAAAIEAQEQQETNDFLAAIAGAPATTALPPAAPRPAPAPAPTPEPAKKQRASAPCETYQDCPAGSLCSDGVCRP